jgi:hypothetical protein
MVNQKNSRANTSKTKTVAKKLVSLALIFNALLTISYALGILSGFYWFFKDWQPFYPFIVNGNIFWIAIFAASLNIVPSARLGRNLKTGRLFFHHYFYGALVLVLAVFFVFAFTGISLLTLFLIENSSVPVNAARFFILGGLTLIIDDLPDTSRFAEKAIKVAKIRTHQIQNFTSIVRFTFGVLSLYVLIAVGLAMYQNSQNATLANAIMLGTLFITAVSAMLFAKKRSVKFQFV